LIEREKVVSLNKGLIAYGERNRFMKIMKSCLKGLFLSKQKSESQRRKTFSETNESTECFQNCKSKRLTEKICNLKKKFKVFDRSFQLKSLKQITKILENT